MSYSSSPIGAVIADVNVKYFLPAIQRPYVWTSDQIVALFDSLLKAYPISTFMFWGVDESTKHEVRSYKFIENYRPDAMNEAVSVDGRNVVLVLDGQQRLTSLLIGLRGTYSEKAKRARISNPDAWTSKSLYLNLLKDPDAFDEDTGSELGVTYGLAFHATRPRNDHRHHWIKVGSILEYPTMSDVEALNEKIQREMHHGVTPYERSLVEKTLKRLHAAIWQENVVNFYTEADQSVDRVLEIFVRANDGGVKLSKADLLMSMITSKWSSGAAREDIHGFVGHINSGIGAPNKITRDFVLKASLVVCDFDVKYNPSSFTAQAIAEIEAKWSRIKAAIETTFRLLNRHGLTDENLGSLNAVMPLIYYIYNSPDFSFRGSSEFERVNAAAMHRWLLNSLFVGAFVGHSDQTIATARGVIREHLRIARDFPIAKLFGTMATGGRLSQLDERAIEELLDLEYGRPRTFVALSLIYGELDWVSATYHVDHIIPRALADRNVLRGMNLAEHQIKEILASVNRLGNLQLLPPGENIEKSDLSFDAWITGRDINYRGRHMIPEQSDLWMVTKLPEFVRAREKLIRQRLLRLVGQVAA